MKRAAPGLSPGRSESEQQNALAADFMTIKLELADTFCKLALESGSPADARQYQVHARAALDAALHALTKARLSEKELEGILPQIEEIKALIESLEAGGASHPNC
jgi:hypothetical protein